MSEYDETNRWIASYKLALPQAQIVAEEQVFDRLKAILFKYHQLEDGRTGPDGRRHTDRDETVGQMLLYLLLYLRTCQFSFCRPKALSYIQKYAERSLSMWRWSDVFLTGDLETLIGDEQAAQTVEETSFDREELDAVKERIRAILDETPTRRQILQIYLVNPKLTRIAEQLELPYRDGAGVAGVRDEWKRMCSELKHASDDVVLLLKAVRDIAEEMPLAPAGGACSQIKGARANAASPIPGAEKRKRWHRPNQEWLTERLREMNEDRPAMLQVIECLRDGLSPEQAEELSEFHIGSEPTFQEVIDQVCLQIMRLGKEAQGCSAEE